MSCLSSTMADAKQEMNNGTSQSRSVLAKPRLGTFGSSGFGSNSFGSILRPSQLKPGNNPFLKVMDTEEVTKDSVQELEKSSTEERLKETKEDAPKFVPLETTGSAPRSSSHAAISVQPATAATGFVFGQNLSERVVIKENINNGDAGPSKHCMSNGTSELLFSSAAASVKENNQEASNSEAGGAGLAAAAAEYERSQARPAPPAAAATTTGEEDEVNVLQISCRLFAWEAGSWRERGRGVLRLNDAAGGGGGGGARLVARVAGSLRVVLNTKLWPRMVAERAGARSLRITAADAGQVKLFLVMGAPGDIVQLHRALSTRIAACKRAQPLQPAAEASAAEGYGPAGADSAAEAEAAEAAADAADAADADAEGCADGEEAAPRLQAPAADAASSEHNALKRKEPADEGTSPKRQCPKIIIE